MGEINHIIMDELVLILILAECSFQHFIAKEMYVCIDVYSLLNDHFLSQRDLICKYIAEVIYGIGKKNAERRGLMVGMGIFNCS